MNVLWDLDGTLTDPQNGIVRCIQFALEQTGRPVPSHEELLWCIGPPLHKSFAKLAPSASEAEIAILVEKYRERFAPTGLFENAVFWGVPEMLGRLGKHRHFVATSKPQIFAQRIIEHFKLDGFFTRVYGSELSGVRSDKGELIAHVLATEGIEPSSAFMIGDRLHDMEGAKKNGLTALGVTWGYGSEEELRNAGAHFTFSSTMELRDFLLDL